MTIIWCMVPEIRSAAENLSPWTVFYPFTPLRTQKIKILKKMKKTPGHIIILHMCTINDNHIMYGSWDIKCHRQNFLSFQTMFCPFYPPKKLKNQILKKLKKMSWDIILLHMHTINDNHMMYGSWDMERDGQNFLSFWTILCHITLLKTWKIKILKNLKKKKKLPGDILILHMCTIKMTIIMCMFPEIWSKMDRIFCHFGPFFALLPP